MRFPTGEGDHHYSLVIAHVEEVIEQHYGSLILHHMTAKGVEVEGRAGHLVKNRILYDGVAVETVD